MWRFRAVIKPNLVSVYHHSGLAGTDYPESTDPRVLDAVVEWVLRFQPNVLIAESSGKPMPTRTSFRLSGVEQIVKFRKTGLVALETCPVRRYLLPKARVMKEVLIPEPFEDVAEYGVQTKQWDIMWIRRCRSAPGGIKWGCRPTQCNHLRPAGIG